MRDGEVVGVAVIRIERLWLDRAADQRAVVDRLGPWTQLELLASAGVERKARGALARVALAHLVVGDVAQQVEVHLAGEVVATLAAHRRVVGQRDGDAAVDAATRERLRYRDGVDRRRVGRQLAVEDHHDTGPAARDGEVGARLPVARGAAKLVPVAIENSRPLWLTPSEMTPTPGFSVSSVPVSVTTQLPPTPRARA